jgi:hypothetical protein
MDLTRRFVFRGNAAALGGQMLRPSTIIIDLDGASSLGVSGGRSQAQIKGRSFGDFIKFGSAFTLAEGLFDDEKRARDVTNHKGRQVELNSTTTVTSEVRELAVGRKPIVAIKRLRGSLVSRAPQGSGEPSIAPTRDTTIQGVAIGGFGLAVNLNCSLFQKYDTRSKVLAAADDGHRAALWRDLHHHRERAPVGRQAVPRREDRWAHGRGARHRHGVLRRAPDRRQRTSSHDGPLRARLARRRLD